jgi:hypothetical protein
MSNNEMYNIIKSAGLEYKLNKMDVDIEAEMFMNDAFIKFVDKKYENKLRDMELITEVRRRMTNLLRLINKVNEIEERAIAINNHDLLWSCEMRKARMINQMEILRDKYDL